MDPGLRVDLERVVGAVHVLTEPEMLSSYAQDWTGRFVGDPVAVVRPGTVEELASVIRLCAAARVPIVPQGGNTGLVGGTKAPSGSILLNTRRLDTIGEVDRLSAQITVGAGATLESVQQVAREASFDVPVDVGARGSATIGGMVATNAGGTRVIRFGMMRAHVHGLEAVLPDGTILSRLGGLIKDNTGYDWPRLLAGSEGTLAIISAVTIGLVPTLSERTVVAIGCDSIAESVRVAMRFRDTNQHLWAAEFVTRAGCELVADQLAMLVPPVFDRPITLLLEFDGFEAALLSVAKSVDSGDLCEADVTVAGPGSPTQADVLWAVRERHTEAINRLGVPVKLDVSLPVNNLGSFADSLPFVAPGAVMFGHLGDGNVHVNLPGLGVEGREIEAAKAEGDILVLVASLGGSISAEHGIGRAKAEWLHLSRSSAEIDLFRRMKQSFDPLGLLNPGCLIPT
jgi:FAD/FMN-containing dehydrogenase